MLCWIGAVLLVVGCTSHALEEPTKPFRGFVAPAHFPPPAYDFEQNPVTEAGFELGRKLFYDPRLSRDGTVSCGSCHAQVHAFADHNRALSFGVDGRIGLRNTPGLANLAWFPSYMWDGGITHLEVMPLAPLTDENEMDIDLAVLLDYLNEETEYPEEFAEAFGQAEVTSQRLLLAISQFQGSMVSASSKYDQFLLDRQSLTPLEMTGLEVFDASCSSCHSGPLFSDFSYRNNGLDSVFTDGGRARITLNPGDMGKFRVPSLRNVALTYPYMHDGRFRTLTEAVAHYADGIAHSETLDPQLQSGLDLSEEDQEALVAFLKTLTDYSFIGDMRFSEPRQ